MDLGSAVLSAELALEFAGDVGGEVRLSSAPIVEGLLAAFVRAAGGATLDEVDQEARGCARRQGEPARTSEACCVGRDRPRQPTSGALEERFVLPNPEGLHARPASLIVTALGGLDAKADGPHRRQEARRRAQPDRSDGSRSPAGRRDRRRSDRRAGCRGARRGARAHRDLVRRVAPHRRIDTPPKPSGRRLAVAPTSGAVRFKGDTMPIARRITAAAAVIAAAALALTGCQLLPNNGGGSTDSPEGLEKFYSQELTWTEEGDLLDSTEVEVPLDWSDPGGETIEIAIMRHKAAGDSLGSLLMNPGGPGGSGYDYVRDYAQYLVSPAVLEQFDLIGFDPRGVNHSNPVICYTDSGRPRRVPLRHLRERLRNAGLGRRAHRAREGLRGRVRGEHRPAARPHRRRQRRPRHGRHARRARRRQDQLPRLLVRHLPRHHVRRAVPREGRQDGAGWRGRPVGERPRRARVPDGRLRERAARLRRRLPGEQPRLPVHRRRRRGHDRRSAPFSTASTPRASSPATGASSTRRRSAPASRTTCTPTRCGPTWRSSSATCWPAAPTRRSLRPTTTTAATPTAPTPTTRTTSTRPSPARRATSAPTRSTRSAASRC